MYVRNWISDSSGNILTEKFFRTRGYMSLKAILPLENNDILFTGIYKPIPGSNDNYSYIVRTDSTLYSKPVYVKLISNIIIKGFNLFQNYPNPYNPNTKIKFDLMESGLVTLNIYNINDKLIQSLINKNLITGSYEVLFSSTDIPSLSSGIYFYQLVFEKKVLATKKMILIK